MCTKNDAVIDWCSLVVLNNLWYSFCITKNQSSSSSSFLCQLLYNVFPSGELCWTYFPCLVLGWWCPGRFKVFYEKSLYSWIEEVGLVGPQVALLLLCGSFYGLVHLANTTSPSLSGAALQLCVQDACKYFTAVDTSDAAWRQVLLSPNFFPVPCSIHSLYLCLRVWPIAISVLQLQMIILLYR